MSELRFEQVTVRFGRGRTLTTAVDSLDLIVRPGTTHGLVGESGSGKSTVARVAVGLTKLDAGRILLDGVDITSRDPAARAARRRVQMVFQDPLSALDPRMSVGASIAEGLLATGRRHTSTQRDARVRELLDLVHIDPARADDRPVAFSVPTGNFGDVFAGYVAARMGLPIAKLIVATNVNDILHRALSQGDYSQGSVVPTPSPSMDIQVSSNFERLLFDLGGRDGAALAAQMQGFEASKAMRLTNAQQSGAAGLLLSDRIDLDDMAMAMRWACEGAGQVIDPHTAIGLAAARRADLKDVPIVTLATAHPAKFDDAVERATGMRPALPARVGDLFDREERYASLPGTFAAVTAYIAERAVPSA